MDKEQFIGFLKEHAKEIAMQEEHIPMLFGVTPEGGCEVAPLSAIDKEKWGLAVRVFLDLVYPEYYAFVSEAYATTVAKEDTEKFERVSKEGVSSLPADDREDILIITLCENKGKVRVFSCKVHPENTGSRIVGDWEEKVEMISSRHLMLSW